MTAALQKASVHTRKWKDTQFILDDRKMRQWLIKYLSFLVACFFLLSFSYNESGTITGRVILTQDSIGEDKLRIDSIECRLYKVNTPVDSFDTEIDAYWYKGIGYELIIDSINFIPISTVFTDKDGNFNFSNVSQGNYLARAFFQSGVRRSKMVVNLKINSSEKLNIKIELPDYCPYYKHRYDKLCPKCRKKDKVIEIYYGEPSEQAITLSGKGNIYIAGECITGECYPRWYCKRDSFKF